MTSLEYLPSELIGVLVSMMEHSQIVNLCQTSPRLYRIGQDREFWESRIRNIRPFGKNLDILPINELIKLYVRILKGGKLFSWGNNNYGRLGLGTTNVELFPRLVDKNNTVIQVSTYTYHLGYVTNEGKLYMCGNGANGRLGLGDTQDRISPVQLPGFTNILQVSCGHEFTAFITQTGQLYTFGHNTDGQLGQPILPTLIQRLTRYIGFATTSDNKEILTPTVVKELSGIRIVQISCGSYHMGAIDSRGKVYLWGWGVHGQLGTGTRTPINDRPICNPYVKDVKQVCCSYYTTLLLTNQGDVYGCGYDDYGELGQGRRGQWYTIPTKILGLPPIKEIAGGPYYSLFLTTAGEVYSCGDLRRAPTRPYHVSYNYPKKISNLPKIKQIYCRFDHAAVISEDNRAYIWGHNRGGILGINSPRDFVSKPTIIPHVINAIQIVCGDGSTAVISD